MRPALLAWSAVAAAGLAVGLVAGYLVVRGPFLGGPALDPVPLLAATGAFIAGTIAATLGATKAARAGFGGG
ncbi:MAG: hypothetical protein ABEH40_05090 [Haloferacaceae archaeon]